MRVDRGQQTDIHVNAVTVYLDRYPLLDMILELTMERKHFARVKHRYDHLSSCLGWGAKRWPGRPGTASILLLYQNWASPAGAPGKGTGRIMKWIVGLGNPGPQYAKTRHNVGFMALDTLAARHGISFNQNKCKAVIGEGMIQGVKTVLIKPMTYMNLSGESVRAYMDYYKVPLEDMIVVYDDLDTEIGRIRLRYQGSAGGHNGIKSIIQHTGTQVFNRVRMGISRPEPGFAVVDYVLSPFPKKESERLSAMIDSTCDALEYSLDHSFEHTMAKFNG